MQVSSRAASSERKAKADDRRYDRLTKLGWRGLFPISVVNVVVTAVVLILLGETL